MAKKKTIIETNAYPIHGTSTGPAEQDVEVGLLLAMELQDAGIMISPEVMGALIMQTRFDPGAVRTEIRIQVPAPSEEDAAPEDAPAAPVYIPDNLTLEQLHKLRSGVNERINEVEKRLRDELDDLPPL